MGWREVSDRIDGRKVWKETNCRTFRMIVVEAEQNHVVLWRLQTEREAAAFQSQQRISLFFCLQPGDSFRF